MRIYTVLLICACAIGLILSGAYAQDAAVGGSVSLELAGLDVTGPVNSRTLQFNADFRSSRSAAPDMYIGEAVNRSLQSFLLGLCLPDDAFWVNLSPVPDAQSVDADVVRWLREGYDRAG